GWHGRHGHVSPGFSWSSKGLLRQPFFVARLTRTEFDAPRCGPMRRHNVVPEHRSGTHADLAQVQAIHRRRAVTCRRHGRTHGRPDSGAVAAAARRHAQPDRAATLSRTRRVTEKARTPVSTRVQPRTEA